MERSRHGNPREAFIVGNSLRFVHPLHFRAIRGSMVSPAVHCSEKRAGARGGSFRDGRASGLEVVEITMRFCQTENT